VFEVFTYLGFLAGVTRDILLGTAAVVLPLREPVLTMKAAATADRLSNGRLLLGVASGDRPVEYPVFGRAFDTRGDAFRSQVEMLRRWTSDSWDEGLQVLPRPIRPLSLLVAGLGQQSLEWAGAHMDGLLAYPRTPQEHLPRTQAWHAAAGPGKPYASFIHIDLVAQVDAPITRHHFGVMTGRQGLIAELEAMREAGIQHIGLHLRRCQRPVAEVLEEIGSCVLPVLHRA
jgi:luciferase-type oxidoreductase